jgi:hypothetical protein
MKKVVVNFNPSIRIQRNVFFCQLGVQNRLKVDLCHAMYKLKLWETQAAHNGAD